MAKADVYGEYEVMLRYYGVHNNPEELSDSELFRYVAHLENIRKAEAEASEPKSKTAF